MKSRLYRLLDSVRKENRELTERVAQLEKELEDTVIINDQLSNAYKKAWSDLVHERNVNDSLVKHSHILFQKLNSMEKIRMVLPNVKEVKIPTLEEHAKAFKPTYDDLESFWKESVANGKTD